MHLCGCHSVARAFPYQPQAAVPMLRQAWGSGGDPGSADEVDD